MEATKTRITGQKTLDNGRDCLVRLAFDLSDMQTHHDNNLVSVVGVRHGVIWK